jgi:hypothetical protein
VKEPELILVVVAGEAASAAGAAALAEVLGDYLEHNGAAMVMWGESLEPFYPLGHRLFRLEAGHMKEQPLLEPRPRPLTAFLPLV